MQILGMTGVQYRVRYRVRLHRINNEIHNTKRGVLHDKPLIDDPMESIVEVHVHVGMARKFGMTAIQSELLQQKSIEVLESFKSIFHEKNGVAKARTSKGPIAFCKRYTSLFSSAG
jgi:hypothetical protein